ncbi:MAG: endopeptidase La [Polyangiaceae bacterium]|nr:endopeptidase La [Polyangiaceae bacterium]MCL4749102.1 endopeptidase La [Myxococcales bacterium]
MKILRSGAALPDSPLPVLPLRSGVLFPGSTLAFNVGRPRSLALVLSLHAGDLVLVMSQRRGEVLEPGFADLHPHGTLARVVGVERQNERTYRVTLEGLERFELAELAGVEPFWRGRGRVLEEARDSEAEARLLAEALKREVERTMKDAGGALEQVPSIDGKPGLFADRVAAGLLPDTDKAQELLATADVIKRLELVIQLLAQAKTLTELRSKIDKNVREQFGKKQREAVLREQLSAIRRELGDGDEGGDGERLRKKLGEAELPEEVAKVTERELRRLEAQGGQGPEANVIRTYLEWLADLPWSRRAETTNDLGRISAQLDEDHFGLDDVKKRILEHMAVHKLSGNPRGTILCLVGPPGVGKTSLGQSIADATGRPFVRIALGGARDEAEIRGHRRTYVGALPGRIVHALRKAGKKNPVILLDEIDKLFSGWAGSPEAALLEVLDPEQNKTFTDHYLEVPFDLSEVLFVCTANTLDTLSAPLRDRLEIVELSGYTDPEKLGIAKKHLIPKRMREVGLGDDALILTDGAIGAIAADFTREAGVRQLDRELTRLLRSVALDVARATDSAPLRVRVEAADVGRYLGKPRFSNDVAERTAVPGVATGLAWTPVGGDILFIETSRMPGKGRLEITGKLGDVMKESARAALTYLRSHASELELDVSGLDESDLHLHVPAGAVPKDGPSAGITIFTALASLLSGRSVRADTAMTGEVTLRGRVLPVGGIKAKVLAAHRAGIRRVILPEKNRRDYEEVPAEAQAALEVVFVTDMRDALAAALDAGPARVLLDPGSATTSLSRAS